MNLVLVDICYCKIVETVVGGSSKPSSALLSVSQSVRSHSRHSPPKL